MPDFGFPGILFFIFLFAFIALFIYKLFFEKPPGEKAHLALCREYNRRNGQVGRFGIRVRADELGLCPAPGSKDGKESWCIDKENGADFRSVHWNHVDPVIVGAVAAVAPLAAWGLVELSSDAAATVDAAIAEASSCSGGGGDSDGGFGGDCGGGDGGGGGD